MIRVWDEESSPAGFSARITHLVDLAGQEVVTSAATEEDVVAAVRAWLAAFGRRRAGDGGDPTVP